jgi:hypothetical protein
MAEQEGKQLLPRTHEMHRRIHACSDEVAKRFVRGVWNPHRRQISRAVQDRELL